MHNNAYLAKPDFLTVTFKTYGRLAGGMAGLKDKTYGRLAGGMAGLKDTLLAFFNDEQAVNMSAVPTNATYFNYQHGFKLQREVFAGETANAGVLAFTEPSEFKTGFNQGLILSLSGVGCYNIDFRYFFELFSPLQPRITRVDFAIDYYDGEVSADDIKCWFQAGCFAGRRGFSPTLGQISRCNVDGVKSDGTTYYVGNRGSSRLARCYDKSDQLVSLSSDDHNMPFPDWFRVEFEFRPAGRAVIPLECFEDVNSFLASAYPRLIPDVLPLPNHSLRVFNQPKHLPLKYINPQFDVSIYHLLSHAKRCYGGLVNVLKHHLNQSSDEIVEALIELDTIPRRLHIPT